MSITLRSGSVNDTRRIGAALAGFLEPDAVLALRGDMGAGKSEFTRGLALGLGFEGYITSPTFTILQVHEGGRLTLYHFDWYRIESPEELYELGMDELLCAGGVSVIEWPGQAEEVLPKKRLEIRFASPDENSRELQLIPMGGFSLPGKAELDEALLLCKLYK